MHSVDLNLYTASQVRDLDRHAIEDRGIEGYELMRRAARAVLTELRRRWPQAARLVIACGPGNNGGDGFLLGRLALREGLGVRVIALSASSHGDAERARRAYLETGGHLQRADTAIDLPPGDVYVDALFGSGFNRPAEGAAAALIERLNALEAPRLSIDVPSGLAADSGVMLGACVRADATVCLVGWKRGLFTHQGRDCCGELALDRLGLPDALYDPVRPDARLMQLEALPPRRQDSHKGRYGHVLVLGGDHGFGGAARLAGEAALRIGAGLVSVATRSEHVAPLLAARPELMVRGVDAGSLPAALMQAASVLVLGPGLGREPWGRELHRQVMRSELPAVIDADGLNLLAESPRDFDGREAVLTPHPGEAARLLECSTQDVQDDRFEAARALARRYRCVVVLKGAGSLVAAPDGAVAVCPWGNPGMASGGMGDVLSGIIGGLLAQRLQPWDAATLGVGLHSRAADRAARRGQRGLLASDLFPALRRLLTPGHD